MHNTRQKLCFCHIQYWKETEGLHSNENTVAYFYQSDETSYTDRHTNNNMNEAYQKRRQDQSNLDWL